MVASNFIDLLKKFEIGSYLGLNDSVDQLNFLFTTVLFLLSSFIVTCNTYFLDSISCYSSVYPTGLGYEKYLNNYCWTSGLIVIPKGSKPPTTPDDWTEASKVGFIAYYQWIPFMLAVQCVMFLIPYWIWRSIYFNQGGADLTNLLSKAKSCQKTCGDQETEIIRKIAENMEQVIYSHRDYKEGRIARMKRCVTSVLGIMIPSKRHATNLVSWYLFIKIMYIANLVGQIYIFHVFFGVYTNPLKLINQLLFEIINGQTIGTIPLFPKLSFCRLPGVRTGASIENSYISQCVLPVNMLSEKVYIVLYSWTLILLCVVFVNILVWLYRTLLSIRIAFIKKALVSSDNYNKTDKAVLYSFVNDFLRQNGVFLLQMFRCNAGDIITKQLVNELWMIYKQKYRGISIGKPKVHVQSVYKDEKVQYEHSEGSMI